MSRFEVDWPTQAELIIQSLRGFVPIVMFPDIEIVIREMGLICHEATKQKAEAETKAKSAYFDQQSQIRPARSRRRARAIKRDGQPRRRQAVGASKSLTTFSITTYRYPA